MTGMIGIAWTFAIMSLISALITSLYSIQSALSDAKREQDKREREQAEQELKVEKREDGLYIRVTEKTPVALLKQISVPLRYTRGAEALNEFYNVRMVEWRDELVGKLNSLELNELRNLPASQLETLTKEIIEKM
jgi:hypothetical protein